MRLSDLKPGDVFKLEGQDYEVERISPSGRVCIAYILYNIKGTLQRVPDPDDLTGDVFKTTFFSDLRFEREHLTDEERAADEELKGLL